MDTLPFIGHSLRCTDAAAADGEVYSVAEDNALRVWSLPSCACSRMIELEETPMALALRPGLDHCALACGRAIYVLDCQELELECQSYLAKSNVDYILYSNRNELIVQLSSGRFYKADCENQYAMKGPFKGTYERVSSPVRIEDNCVGVYSSINPS